MPKTETTDFLMTESEKVVMRQKDLDEMLDVNCEEVSVLLDEIKERTKLNKTKDGQIEYLKGKSKNLNNNVKELNNVLEEKKNKIKTLEKSNLELKKEKDKNINLLDEYKKKIEKSKKITEYKKNKVCKGDVKNKIEQIKKEVENDKDILDEINLFIREFEKELL